MSAEAIHHGTVGLMCGLTTTLAVVSAARAAERPNILIVVCDDMGYGDLECYGQPYIRTPNLNRMAEEGMRFTQAYAGSPVSAPSRACLMTGQHTGHTEVRGNKEYWRNVPTVSYGVCKEPSVSGQHPYDPDHVILPEIMKDMGYRTGMFGKWAGGYEGSVSTPDKRGIDEFYGYICQYQAHAYYPNFLNRYSAASGDTGTVRELMEENIFHPMTGEGYRERTQYSADIIHRKAMEWLSEQKAGTPFFGLLTYTIPHAELLQPEDSIYQFYRKQFFWDRTWGGQEGSRYHESEHVHAQFAAMITRLDAYMGEIFALLNEKGLAQNTLVIFTSDNGPHEEGGADPAFFGRDGKLRGLKRQCYEGGIRVPFIAWWPGHVPAGKVNDHVLAFYDILPTCCDIAGVKNYVRKYSNKKDEGYFDGISFAPTLLGDTLSQKSHPWLYWEFHETDQMALRLQYLKMVVVKGVPRLYNLEKDIHEDNDIAAQYPEIVRLMVGILLEQHRESDLFKVTLPKY